MFFHTVSFARYRRRAKRMYLLCKVFLAFNLLFGTSTCIIKKSLAFFLKINLFRPLNIWVKITHFFSYDNDQSSFMTLKISSHSSSLCPLLFFCQFTQHWTPRTRNRSFFILVGQKQISSQDFSKRKKNWSSKINCGILRKETPQIHEKNANKKTKLFWSTTNTRKHSEKNSSNCLKHFWNQKYSLEK